MGNMIRYTADMDLHFAKQVLGEFKHLDLSALTCVDAHRVLGQEVKPQVQGILIRRLDGLSNEKFTDQIRLSRYCEERTRSKIDGAGDKVIRDALQEYLLSLTAWSEGLDLSGFSHSHLEGITIDNMRISALDLAFLLVNDQTWCQTGIMRERDGSVAFWHTEEDREEEYVGERLDRLRIVTFTVIDNDVPTKVSSFIYPDLLPGSAFGWRADGYFQAVDALYMTSWDGKRGLLANMATWLGLRLGNRIALEETLGFLGPFADGYAVTIVQEDNGAPSGKMIEFAGQYVSTKFLPDAPGSYLFHVNVFADMELPIAQEYHEVKSPVMRKFFSERISRTHRYLDSRLAPKDDLAFLFELLCSQEGRVSAYANAMDKAYVLGRLMGQELMLSFGSGPAMVDDKLTWLHFRNP